MGGRRVFFDRDRLRLQDPKVQEMREETRHNRWQITVKSVTEDYQIVAGDEFILIDTRARAVTVTLPNLTTVREGRIYAVVREDGTNAATLATFGGDTIGTDVSSITSINHLRTISVFKYTHPEFGARWHRLWTNQ